MASTDTLGTLDDATKFHMKKTEERKEGKMTENQWAKAKIDSLFFHWLSCEQGGKVDSNE